MNALENYGLIIRELRKLRGLSVRKAAEQIERSIGWLSEIENEKGTASLNEKEFARIVAALDGDRHRAMFKTWVANYKNRERTDKTFDGAVLKYIRHRKGYSLKAAAELCELSRAYLCNLETGAKPMTLLLRAQIMRAYGYNPSSFKNLSTDPLRSKVVPSKFKFSILMKSLTPEQEERFYSWALAQPIWNELLAVTKSGLVDDKT